MASQRFYLPTEIVTGVGCFAQLGKMAAPFGKRALVVGSPRRLSLLDRATQILAAAGVAAEICAVVGGEPTLAVVEEVRTRARAAAAEW